MDETERRQLVDLLVTNEATARREVMLAEEMAFTSIEFRAQKDIRETEKKLEQQRNREDEELMKTLRTLNRRIEGVAHEEMRRRIDIEQSQELQLEAILRVLERDIQTDVDSIQYTDYQRVKYFNKTLAVIIKNEGAGRRDIINSERYEWLLLVQRHDSAATQIAMQRKLAEFREGQQRKRMALQGTLTSTELRRAKARDERALSRSSSRKRHDAVLPRTQDRLAAEFYDRSLSNLQGRETTARNFVSEEESLDWAAIERLWNHLAEQRMAALQRESLFTMDDAVRTFLRKMKDLDRAETAARAALGTEERGGWLAIERKHHRRLISEEKRWEKDMIRNIAHRRKIEDREQKMALARLHFAERQALLSDAVVAVEYVPSPSSRNASPVLPHPPLFGLQTSARSRRVEAMRNADQPDPKAISAASQLSVSIRALQAVQAAGRFAIEKDERLERYAIVCSAQPTADKQARATQRRQEQTFATESKIVQRIENDLNRSSRQKTTVTMAASMNRASQKVQRDELNARAALKAEEDGWWQRFEKYADAVTGKVLLAIRQLTAQETEVRDRHVVLEARCRAALVASAAAHKPQSRVVKVQPLPPPKSKFDFSWKPQQSSSSRRQAPRPAPAAVTTNA